MSTAMLKSRCRGWDLLAQACRRGQLARVYLADGPLGARTLPARLLRLSEEGVFLQPPEGQEHPPPLGTPIHVYFQHDRSAHGFVSRACGSGMCPESPGGGRRAGWRLSLPERVEPRDQRAAVRVGVPAILQDNLTVLLAPLDPTRPPIEARLRDLSTGGLQVLAAGEHLSELLPPAMFLARFELPGEPGPFAFRVRSRHCHRASTRSVVVGFSFCTDPASFVGRVEQKRLERALRLMARAGVGTAAAPRTADVRVTTSTTFRSASSAARSAVEVEVRKC